MATGPYWHYVHLLLCMCSIPLHTQAQDSRLSVHVANDGQVVLTLYNVQGALCSLTDNDARVVCRSIGASQSGFRISSVYLTGSSKVWLSQLSCSGSERHVDDCPKRGWNPTCSGNLVAAITCRDNNQGTTQRTTLRLATTPFQSLPLTVRLDTSSGGSTSGRVIAVYYGEVGRLCAEDFDFRDAQVVCRMLNYKAEGARVQLVPQVAGKIWLTRLNCEGNENSIADCGPTWTPQSCPGGYDAGVICQANVAPILIATLEGGPDRKHGRVKIQGADGTGTLCSSAFGSQEVAVVCRMITGSSSGGIQLGQLYGPGSGNTVATTFRCQGTETNLNQCDYDPPGLPCYHTDDISIGCGPIDNQPAFSVMLLGGPTRLQGRVQFKYYGQTGAVCDTRFGFEEAKIVCRLLNYYDENTIRVVGNRYESAPESSPILVGDLECTGRENSFAECPHSGWRRHQCSQRQAVSVECGSSGPVTPTPTPASTMSPSYAQVVLTGGADYRHGILAVLSAQDGWRTVCRNGFSMQDLAVICRMITNRRDTAGVLLGYLYGAGPYQSVQANFYCGGSERNINECTHQTASTTCSHADDLSIGCGDLVLPGVPTASVALVDGSGRNHGRVELTYYGKRGTICENSFGFEEARVICRMLGYNGYDVSYVGNRYGPGADSLPVLLDQLQCTGDESTIVECSNSGWNTNFCRHSQDVSVHCGPLDPVTPAPTPVPTMSPSYTQVLLTGGADNRHGILTVLSAQDGWRTVCRNGFSRQNLAVICRMITNRRDTAGVLLGHLYGAGPYQSVQANFYCGGSERTINECTHQTASTTCSHADDLSIGCGDLVFPGLPTASVALVDGSDRNHGRVELTYYGKRGTICANSFGFEEARIICRMLGYNGYDVSYVGNRYGPGADTLPVLLDQLQCMGDESTIAECSNSGWNTNFCSHSQDVGVHCGPLVNTPRPTTPTTIAPRPSYSRVELVDGPDRLHGLFNIETAEGRLQYVCSNSFSQNSAAVLCRMLTGRQTQAQLLGRLYGPGKYQPVSINFQCRGHETSLNECHYEIGNRRCDRSEAISIGCGNLLSNRPAISTALVNGPSYLQGRVELRYYGKTGTVCSNSFGVEEAQVVCRSIGYSDPYTSYYVGSQYGAGDDSMPILLDHLNCRGNEATLANCSSSGWGVHSCSHTQDVSVHCGRRLVDPPDATTTFRPVNGPVTLLRGPDRYHGIVTVRLAQGSGTVCGGNLREQEARVLCRMLTGRSVSAMLLGHLYGANTGPSVSLNIECQGDEFDINQCPYRGSPANCQHDQDISLGCGPLESNQEAVSVTLMGGPDRFHGRLHVTAYGETGTVCSNGFGNHDAIVVCNMLGYRNTFDVRPVGSRYGQGPEFMGVLMSDLQCVGTESSIDLCRHAGWRNTGCTHYNDVSVHCGPTGTITTPQPSTFRPRPSNRVVTLEAGDDHLHGRVMIEWNSEKGTICDDLFDDKDAKVICRMLGYYGAGAVSAKNFFGGATAGTGIWLNRLECAGTEQDVTSCQHSGWDSNTCGHHEDVGVLCGPKVTPGPPVRVFLKGGSDRLHGRLLVEYGHSNGTVCDEQFDVNDAKVVCHMLGYYGNQISVATNYGEGSGKIWLTKVMCIGDETSISNCFYPPWGEHDCDHSEDIGVNCGPIRGRP